MRDWERFSERVPWFTGPGDVVVVGDEGPWTRGSLDGLPRLSALLTGARVTPVSVSGRAYELLAWGPADNRRGWLCEPPPVSPPGEVPEIHRLFWSVCGGIVERFGEPASWWLNQDDVLTVEAAGHRVAGQLEDYRWIWADAGLDVPIEPDAYYPVAIEANGNLTIAGRRGGELLLFAPDHAFAGVRPLAGCPPESLLTIDGVPDLGSWIEACAGAWLDAGQLRVIVDS
ncbi:hypothetical protein [Actinophytocola sediminis]